MHQDAVLEGLLVSYMLEDKEYHLPRHEQYALVKHIDGKFYFPHYTYESHMTDNAVLQHYGHASYSPVVTAIAKMEKDNPDEKYFIFAEKSDPIYCKCLNNKFTFSYGSYELYFTCSNCGNSWSAYSG